MENYIIANKTDVGSTRQVNEDSMITFDSPNGRVVAVCDGMGGQAAGDVASKLSCDIIRDILENNTFSNPNEAITRAIVAANQGVLHRASISPELEGMGATCVMLIINQGKVYYGWVGDSRIYYISNHTIRQLSRDQSYVQMLVDSGQITPEEAANHPQKNEITNAIGVAGMTPPMLGQAPIVPEKGSTFLLCSDGLSGMVTDSQIEHIVSKTGVSLQDKANLLVDLANQQGGLDNITVQLVQFSGVQGPAMMPQMGGAPNAVVAQEKKKRTILYICAAVILLLGICGSLYYLFGTGNSKKEADEPQIETKTIDNRKPAPKAVETEPAKKVEPAPQETTKPAAKPTTTKPEKPKTNKPDKSTKGKGAEKIKEKADESTGTGATDVREVIPPQTKEEPQNVIKKTEDL